MSAEPCQRRDNLGPVQLFMTSNYRVLFRVELVLSAPCLVLEQRDEVALEEENEPLDVRWPQGWRKRITYVFLAPLIFLLWLTIPDVRRPVSIHCVLCIASCGHCQNLISWGVGRRCATKGQSLNHPCCAPSTRTTTNDALPVEVLKHSYPCELF